MCIDHLQINSLMFLLTLYWNCLLEKTATRSISMRILYAIKPTVIVMAMLMTNLTTITVVVILEKLSKYQLLLLNFSNLANDATVKSLIAEVKLVVDSRNYLVFDLERMREFFLELRK